MIQSIKAIAVSCALFLLVFNIHAQPNIARIEYYVDNDPGYGNATTINFTPGNNLIDSTIKIDPATLVNGVHLVGIRAKDAKGAWSLDNKWLLVKNTSALATPDIIHAEYYIDNDPGYGNATAINLMPGINLIDSTIKIDPASLVTGVHLFGIRVKDANGAWSLDNKWMFVKNTTAGNTPDIIHVEYYIDNDPGYGNATAISLMQGTSLIDSTIKIDPASLATGVHLFGIRAKDANGSWSIDNKWLFVKNILQNVQPNIVRVEYYIDTDPGYGNATLLNIIPAKDLQDSTVNLNVGALSDGSHTFVIRAQDSNGAWSLDNKWQFINSASGTTPIILAGLTGRYINNANELTAVIEQAVNVKAIAVEKSIDGTHFTYLGNMAVAPVTAGTYKFEDKNPEAGNIFYRLHITDIDGKTSYSYVILLNHTSRLIVQMFPNPVQDNLTAHFENAAEGIYTINVTDILGKNLVSHKINISQNNQSGDVNISFNRYAAGTYFVQVRNALNNIVTTQKIIKK